MSADRGYRVLIVDDEAAVRQFVDRVLRDGGYETVLAGDGRAALDLSASSQPFHLLIADLRMPGMRGDEVARRLRIRDPDLKVLYFTGFADRLFAERAVLSANEAFLDKPVSATGLLEAVSLCLFGHTRGMAKPS